jgi:hypothetical protein
LEKNPKMRFFVQNNWAAFNIDAQGWHSKGMANMGEMDKWDKTMAEQIPNLNATSVKLYEEQVDKINKEIGHSRCPLPKSDKSAGIADTLGDGF